MRKENKGLLTGKKSFCKEAENFFPSGKKQLFALNCYQREISLRIWPWSSHRDDNSTGCSACNLHMWRWEKYSSFLLFFGDDYYISKRLMSHTIERTPFKWEKGRGDKCCPGPESCLARARPVLGASVSEWHIRPWDRCHGAQRQGGVYLCQAPGGMVARGSGCAHRFSPKLGNPGIVSVWDWRVVASNTYPHNSGTESSHTEAAKGAE